MDAKPFFMICLLIAVLAALVGAKIVDLSWVSAPIAEAQARQMDADTSDQTAKGLQDQHLREAQTNLAIQEITQTAAAGEVEHQVYIQKLKDDAWYASQKQQNELDYQTALNQQKLVAQERRDQLLNNLLVLAVICLCTGLLLAAIFYTVYAVNRNWARAASTKYQAQIGKLARNNERLFKVAADQNRKIQALENERKEQEVKALAHRLTAVTTPVAGGNGTNGKKLQDHPRAEANKQPQED